MQLRNRRLGRRYEPCAVLPLGPRISDRITIRVGRPAISNDVTPGSTNPDELGSHYPSHANAWLSVGILQIFSLLAVTDRQIIALLVQPIKADLQLTDTEIGMLQGLAFGMCYGLAGLPIGWAVDRYPRRFILFLGISFWSLSATACGLARDFTSLFVGRMAVGVGEATNNPAAVSLISDLFPPTALQYRSAYLVQAFT